MDNSIKKIIAKLGKKLQHLKQPIQILAICSGGKVVGQNLHSYLLEKNIQSKDFEGTAVIVEDVIWNGTQLPPVKQLLHNCNPHKKFYIASLLDVNKKADFSVFK